MKNNGTKVCHITSAHGRYDTRIFVKQCRSLAEAGFDVTLIVNDEYNDEVIDGIKIISTKFKPRNRKERFLDSKKNLWKRAVEIDADIYQLHDPDLLKMGNRLRRGGKKVIFDSHEDISEQIKDKEWIPKYIRNLILKLYKVYEKYSLSRYEAVVSVTPHIVDKLKKINKNSVMITNYPIIDDNRLFTKKKERKICFAGGVTEQYHHHNIISAIEGIDNVEYLLAGNVDEEYLNRLKSLPAWGKVRFKGVIPHYEVKNMYSISSVGVAIHRSTQMKKEGSLGVIKLFEFMEAALPVIATNYALWEEVVNKYECGICVNPDNVDEIKKAVEYLLNNPEEGQRMGENGRRAVLEEYNWETQAIILLNLYDSLLLED